MSLKKQNQKGWMLTLACVMLITCSTSFIFRRPAADITTIEVAKKKDNMKALTFKEKAWFSLACDQGY